MGPRSAEYDHTPHFCGLFKSLKEHWFVVTSDVRTSCPENAVAPHAGGVHPDEMRRHPLNPRLKPGADERRALGLGIQMMCRSSHQHDPPLARLQVDLVGLHGDP